MNDFHMVASGVPEKNGDKHAPEIATMALDLLVRSNTCIPIPDTDTNTRYGYQYQILIPIPDTDTDTR